MAVGCAVGVLGLMLVVGPEVRTPRGAYPFLCVILGGLWLLGANGRFSIFECGALIAVGAVLFALHRQFPWRYLLGGGVALLAVWLVARFGGAIPAWLHLSWGAFGTVVLAPCLVLPLRRRVQPGNLVALVVLLLGVVGLMNGGLALSWRTVTLSLPFVFLLGVLSWWPRRWYKIVLYGFYLISLVL